ncbi:MAG TPA: 3-methyl-2-oxobutanoate hydroxymethyltransferase [Nitrososphaeraceae archaeon]|jgi:3-methyl-2-oxobutanoate hydroxymethyltransferase|nr:3-methyl-2-oxobutanoate hydroxymethyltransferase [Nitrososphaeraceae archaeon]
MTTTNGKARLKKMVVNDIVSMKNKEKISVITSYDYWSAKICDNTGIDIILVGDSGGMVMLGYNSTVPVNMKEMLIFSKAVSLGTKRSLIVSDMPFGSYQVGIKHAVRNAIRFIKTGSDAVKLEGGIEIIDRIKAIKEVGIPVMGHIGLKPQTTKLWEGYRVQGNTAIGGSQLLKEAIELEKAGVFAIVLEMVTSEVADLISRNVKIPTIGIGSGPHCDGQVLVLHDMLNLYDNIKPRFVKTYTNLSETILNAIRNYITDVKTGKFPEDRHSYKIEDKEFERLVKMIKRFRKKLS